MVPLRLSANALAAAIGAQPNRITGIVNAERDITADTALRLARYFSGEADWWPRLQGAYDLSPATRTLGKRLLAIEPRTAA